MLALLILRQSGAVYVVQVGGAGWVGQRCHQAGWHRRQAAPIPLPVPKLAWHPFIIHSHLIAFACFWSLFLTILHPPSERAQPVVQASGSPPPATCCSAAH